MTSHKRLNMTKHNALSKSGTSSAAQNRYKPSTLSSAERVSKGAGGRGPQPSIRPAGLLRVLCVAFPNAASRHHIGRTPAQKLFALCTALLLVVGACAAPGAQQRPALPTKLLPVAVQQAALAEPAQPCTGSFVAHNLDFIAELPGGEAHMFDANGAGAAIGDLDGDERLDVVLANQRGPNMILWNAGGLRFRAEPMPARDSRAVNLVDVDGDGQLD